MKSLNNILEGILDTDIDVADPLVRDAYGDLKFMMGLVLASATYRALEKSYHKEAYTSLPEYHDKHNHYGHRCPFRFLIDYTMMQKAEMIRTCDSVAYQKIWDAVWPGSKLKIEITAKGNDRVVSWSKKISSGATVIVFSITLIAK